MDLNKVHIIGRLTRDPELRTTPQGAPVCNFSVATSHSWKDAAGNSLSKTEYHDIVVWRRTAELCGQYLKKSSKVYIEGRLETRSWNDQNGDKKYRTEIVSESVIFLDDKHVENQNRQGGQGVQPLYQGEEQLDMPTMWE